MNFFSKNALLGLVALSSGALVTSCDKDGDGDSDLFDKCYECENSQTEQMETICSDNYESFIDIFGIDDAADFDDAINQLEALPNVECQLTLR